MNSVLYSVLYITEEKRMLIQRSNKHHLKDDVDEVFLFDFDFSYAVDDIHSVDTMVIAPISRL